MKFRALRDDKNLKNVAAGTGFMQDDVHKAQVLASTQNDTTANIVHNSNGASRPPLDAKRAFDPVKVVSLKPEPPGPPPVTFKLMLLLTSMKGNILFLLSIDIARRF